MPGLEVTNNLAELRKRIGFSVSTLAAEAGVTRQAIYAIEAGAYMPNTTVSLRLARALGVNVDDIFRLEDAAPTQIQVAMCEPNVEPGVPVQVASLDGKLVAMRPSPQQWYLPASDAVTESVRAGHAKIRLHRPDSHWENRIVICGCDPATSVLARHLQRAGVEAVLVHRNSSEALALLKRGRVHIAGTHLRRALPHDGMAVITFANWQEGLVVTAGNPKRIKSVEDLARKNVRFLNREKGAGTRVLFDEKLAKAHLKPEQVRGYRSEAPGHLAAAAQVAEGRADCCIATEAAARALGLHFVALGTARYDFFLRRSHLDLAPVRTLLDVITRSDFRRELKAAAGYDTAVTGRRVV